MTEIDVVIISWAKTPELHKITKAGLDSLFDSAEDGVTFHAYVVESNPDIEYEEYNQFLWMHSCTTIHPNQEFGYHKFLNIGRRSGNSPYVVLCNSDLTYEKGWANRIIESMKLNPTILSASPWCPQTQGDNTPHLGKIYQGYQIRKEVAGWCIFQQRKIYEIIGELDERFKFWYADNDYALDLQKRGIPHALVPDSVVNHHEKHLGKTGETLSELEKYQITSAQREIFLRKWGNHGLIKS
jgi:hypothetical protein